MVLNPVASTVMVIFFILLSTILVGALVAITVVLYRLNAKLEEVTLKVDPLLSRTEDLLTVANEKLTTIGGKAEVILTQTEAVTTGVQAKVEKTATAVQRTIHAPIIGANSLAAGLLQGFATFTRLQSTQKPVTTVTALVPVDTETELVPVTETLPERAEARI
jgi:uncharacterized protein YoxC